MKTLHLRQVGTKAYHEAEAPCGTQERYKWEWPIWAMKQRAEARWYLLVKKRLSERQRVSFLLDSFG
ncbi:hypothetical protein EFB08_19140 [Rufibacter latericius]|uniref:Uncharacterized protein n=1 Tax=Rufibacter latericius TaxID=2487040 RepID=A0A3M9MFJ7_9BACT|nr:hypothetical protein EFB08_19140 [Rufibacter latericius]